MNRRSFLRITAAAPVAAAGAMLVPAMAEVELPGMPVDEFEFYSPPVEMFSIEGYKNPFYRLPPEETVVHVEPDGRIAVGAHVQVIPDGSEVIHWTMLPERS